MVVQAVLFFVQNSVGKIMIRLLVFEHTIVKQRPLNQGFLSRRSLMNLPSEIMPV